MLWRCGPILLLTFLFLTAHAQSRIDCNAFNSHILGEAVHYCVMLPPGYDAAARSVRKFPVLYYLHGLGDNEQTLFKGGGWGLIQDLRQQNKITDFLIVAPEGKASFYINSADHRVRYNDFFASEFIPFIEGRYAIRRERKSRGISGVSMGGYGALRFAFAHPELFGSVSAQSPALMIQGTQSRTSLGQYLGSVFGNPIDTAHWKANDPLALAKMNPVRLRGLAMYFNCGRDDEYGFEVGTEALDRELTSAKIPHEYHLYPGNHSGAYFLAHIEETMEFHSRSFEK
jgi:S-formylglutathione hydrolase FrmB